MSSRSTLGTIKRIGAILIAIAIVLAAGILVGQAPAIFGVEEDPEAAITFEDQERDGTSVTITNVTLSDGGFVVVTDGESSPIAVSDYLESGSHENVTIEVDEDADGELVGQLTATVHQDTTDDEAFAYEESDGEEDRPYLEDGFPVSDTATVTTPEEEGVTDSFVVESMDAPSTATTNETIEVVAEIRNPTDLETQQSVAFRLDGEVIEQQLLDLGPEETREVTFEIDTRGTNPGDRTIGVYTNSDGVLQSIDLEFHTDPSVTVTNATTERVTFDTAIPAEGFVAVESNETDETNGTNESVLGTSEPLISGEHENVTVDLEEPVEEDEELTATLYEGAPDDPDNATAIVHDNETVETTFTVANATTDDRAESEISVDRGDGDGNAADEANESDAE